MIAYLIASILIAAAAFAVRRERHLFHLGVLFYAAQAAFAGTISSEGSTARSRPAGSASTPRGRSSTCCCASSRPSPTSTPRPTCATTTSRRPAYSALVMLLTTAITGAYFASNLAVTWIFLEATTLCSAGIIYHRRTAQTLEAA